MWRLGTGRYPSWHSQDISDGLCFQADGPVSAQKQHSKTFFPLPQKSDWSTGADWKKGGSSVGCVSDCLISCVSQWTKYSHCPGETHPADLYMFPWWRFSLLRVGAQKENDKRTLFSNAALWSQAGSWSLLVMHIPSCQLHCSRETAQPWCW